MSNIEKINIKTPEVISKRKIKDKLIKNKVYKKIKFISFFKIIKKFKPKVKKITGSFNWLINVK